MGTAVGEMAAGSDEFEVADRYDIDRPLPEEKPSSFQPDDVIIDFTLPDVVLSNIQKYCRWNQPAVIGTTGWYADLDQVRDWVAESETGVLYAPNFSLGVALMVRGLREVAPLIDQIPAYDAYVHEIHHTGKVDSPSGTALSLARELVDRISRKERVETETQHQRIEPSAVHVTSTRAGTIYGEHTVGFDGPYDQITVGHEAKNRRGFAAGAVRAAEWLEGRRGLFTLDDMLEDWLAG